MTATATIVLLALLVFAPLSSAQENEEMAPVNDLPKPETFDDFNDAVSHARDKDKIIFIACTKKNHPDSFKLAKLVRDNTIFLAAEKVAVYTYEVEDDARLATFKSHFKVSSSGAPLVVITDSWGKPLGHKAGLAGQEAYVEWIKTVGGKEAIEIPPEGMFGLRKGDLVGSVDLSETRTWTTVTGQKFTAALTEAKGSVGIFRTEAGRILQVGFNSLSKPDIEYLKKQNILQMQ